MALANRIWKFVDEQTRLGRTVRFVNALTDLRVERKHVEAGAIRLRGEHVEVQRGRRWDSVMGMRVSALYEVE